LKLALQPTYVSTVRQWLKLKKSSFKADFYHLESIDVYVDLLVN
jgi:hypothetical protein